MASQDELTGTEMVARAFHKHLRGVPLYVSKNAEDVCVTLGNYKLTFRHADGILVIADVSDAS